MKVRINDIEYEISLAGDYDTYGQSECAQTAKPITKGKNNFKVKPEYLDEVLLSSERLTSLEFRMHFEYRRFSSAHQAKVYLKQFKIRYI